MHDVSIHPGSAVDWGRRVAVGQYGDVEGPLTSTAARPQVEHRLEAHPGILGAPPVDPDHPSETGTFGNSTAASKIDYLLLSPRLYDRVTGGGMWRNGVWGGTPRGDLWPIYDTITKPAEAASDHAALYADLAL